MTVHLLAQAEIAQHLETRETDIHTVQNVGDIEHEQEGDEAPGDLSQYGSLPEFVSRLARHRTGSERLFDRAGHSCLLRAAWLPEANGPSRPGPGPADDLANVASFVAVGDRVDGVDVRLSRGLDDVGRGCAAPVRAIVAFDFQLQGHFALGILPLGHAPDDEFVEVGMNARDALDGLEDRVNRTVADGRILDDLAVGAADRDR